jgi:hypothetical protein
MSCARSKFGAGDNQDYADYIDFINNRRRRTNNSSMNNSSMNNSSMNCRRGFLPSFTPVLSGLSVTTSTSGVYSLVYVYGSNFLPNGTTFIQFGGFGYLPVTYYSSYNLSFVVPLNATAGNYNVKVVNLYNGNFSPQINQSYPGNLNFSQSITYTIT